VTARGEGGAAGARVGKYQLLGEIGRGAMGAVYRAEDRLSGEVVAVKLLEPVGEAERELCSRLFFNEVGASGLLHHPNIVPVRDAGREGDRFYVVMDYVEGGRTLEAWCTTRSLLSLERILSVGLDCAEALHYAHVKGVIHRDVKPANVLLDGGGHARLTDFGIAVLGQGGLAATSPFAAAGSPLYMAPEQLRRDEVTPRSDLFALGLVLYQLITGRHPFAASSMAAVTRRVLEDTPELPSRYRPDLPPGLEAVVMRLLEKESAARPASGLEVANVLSTLLGGPRRPLEGVLAEGRADQLRRLAFFRDFEEAQLWELLRWTRWEEVAPGAVLLREGEAGDSFFIIVDGRVAVSKAGLTVTQLSAGQCIGEVSCLGRRPRSASVTALEPVRVLRVNAALLENASKDCQIAFQRVFISTLVERLVDTTEALARGA
jgi:hypothetical protein